MHTPVMLQEVVGWLDLRPGARVVDATLGGGGHAEALLARIGPSGFLLGFDADGDAVDRVRRRLAAHAGSFEAIQSRFSDMVSHAAARGLAGVDAVLMDLGVSSWQLDEPERGFSFRFDGPLDMRMDRREALTAADLVNGAEEAQLTDWIGRYGEEPAARRIARAIVRRRGATPFATTADLAAVVEAACGGRRGRIHPATRTFQALRIAVNREDRELADGLGAALSLLRPGGRLAVISFHSLEDRRVKDFFRSHAGRWESRQEGGRSWIGERPPVRILTKKPVAPAERELDANPRARSARLRVAERMVDTWSEQES